MPKILFEKMHGIGNDFVLIDGRKQSVELNAKTIQHLANRHKGIGFDQLIIVEDSGDADCDASYTFYNPDGSQAEQCGNGQRCISLYLHSLNPEKKNFAVSGLAGKMYSSILENNQVKVNMGKIHSIEIKTIQLQKCFQVDFGNPHLVAVVDDVDKCDLISLNTTFTQHYPQGINFEIVQIQSKNQIKIRVHERGTGETQACGSGACAAVGALQKAGDCDNTVKVLLPGGTLVVEYVENEKNYYLTGEATHVYSGEIII